MLDVSSAEIVQLAPDYRNDRYLMELRDAANTLPVTAIGLQAHQHTTGDNEQQPTGRVYTLTLPLISNGTCAHHRRRSAEAVDTTLIPPPAVCCCSTVQNNRPTSISPSNGSAGAIDCSAMSLPSSKRVHFARPFC